MSRNNNRKPIVFRCPHPGCDYVSQTNNTNRKQKCLGCGKGVELDLKKNGGGKNSSIEVLAVRPRE